MADDLIMSPGEAVIDDEAFVRFRDFFYRKTGTYYDDNKRYFVDKRLLQRMKVTGCQSFREYLNLLRFQASGEELQELINRMTVNETYFFREAYQFRCLVNNLMDDVVSRKSPGEHVRILSAPCSTGEEPYSIGMHLLEYWPGIARHDIEIVGADIDTEALDAAREGVYGRRALQALPAELRLRYFTEESGGRFRLDGGLRDAITFSRLNLCDVREIRSHRPFDIVFCRNLLIYFDDQSRREAAENLYDMMVPGGYICLGHSEFMSRISPLFKPRQFADAMVYQRPEETL